jgi:hypothetical protein
MTLRKTVPALHHPPSLLPPIGILHLRGHRNIAAALRRNATRVLPLLGITSP